MSPAISFVVPFLNEEATLRPLVEQLLAAVAPVLAEAEECSIILVDDGSTDNSVQVAERLVREHSQVRLYQLQGNFGKSAALACGFLAARGSRIVFTLDADLQDDPKEIPRFLAKLDEGYDLVSGYKRKRHDPISKVLPSRVFNWMVRTLTGIALHDVNCGFKAYRGAVLENVSLYGDLHRFIPVLAQWKRFRVGELEVEHHPRKHGVSKFGGGRFFRGLMDLLTVFFLLRYDHRPLHFFGVVGVFLTGVGMLVNLYLTALWALGHSIGHRPLLILGVLLLVVGVQFLATGLMAELLVYRSPSRPPYVLRRVLGAEDVSVEPANDGQSGREPVITGDPPI